MAILEYGEWLPDLQPLGNAGVVKATNVLPAARGYGPMQKLVTTSSALDARPRGAVQGVDRSEVVYHYAGDALKLYENVSETWTDRSITGGYSTAAGERWEFAQFKNKMLATNFSDSPQQITFGGSNFSDLTTSLEGRHISVVRDFVVLASTNDASDGEIPDRVRWSAIDDETDWTVSASTLSDFQDLKTGSVEYVLGGEYGVVFQQDAVWRMTFVGSPTVFQFDEVLPGIGAIAPGAVARIGNFAFFLSERGFYSIRNGTTVEPIGANKINKFVLGQLDDDNLNRMSVATDRTRVYWAFPGSQNTGGRPEKIIVFDTVLNKWSLIELDVEHLFSASGTGLTLENLDNQSSSIDDLEASLDSDIWKGGQRESLSGFGTDFKSGFFDGFNMDGTIVSKEYEFTPGRQSNLLSFRHVVDGGNVTAKVGKRENQADNISFGSTLTERSTGRFTPRVNARYHQIQLDITGDYEHAIGVQVERDDIKSGGRRGR